MHVTVIIPAYNTQDYIQYAIFSATRQSHKDRDILVVDDGSTDNTAEKAYAMCGEDVPLSVISYKENRGLAHALAVGIDYANGPLLTFLGSDDMLLENSLADAEIQFRKNPKLGYAWTNFQYMNGRRGWSENTPKGMPLWDALCVKRWWRGCAQQFWLKQVYRTMSRGLDESILYAVDLQLAVVMAETGCDTMFIPSITYNYRSPRPGSISTSSRPRQSACAQTIIEDSKRINKERG